LQLILWILYPLVQLTAVIANGFLKLFGISRAKQVGDSLNREELRTIVSEAAHFIPRHHRAMLLGILDLEKILVDHIMIPRNEVKGIDLQDSGKNLVAKLSHTQHTLLPVYRDDLENIVGILHTRDVIDLLAKNEINEKTLLAVLEEPYFVPEGTSLHMQLRNFQKQKKRMGLVVNEYGDILGLVTLEDILEEIVGEFTTENSPTELEIIPQEDGSFLVEGGVSLRELNREYHWDFPTSGPTTLSGLLIEHLEAIPNPGTSVLIAGHPIEIIQIKDNMVKTARIYKKKIINV